MTEDMGKLFQDASDDGGRPVGFAIEELVARGRRQMRVRRSRLAAVAGVAAASLAVGGFTAWPSATEPDPGPAFSTSDDDGLIERCADLNEAYDDTLADRPIDEWSIRVRQADDESISMMLAPDDQREFAYCRLDLTGGHELDDYWRRSYYSIIAAYSRATDLGDSSVLWSSGGATSEKIGRMTLETADGVVSEAARHGRYYVWQHPTTASDPSEPVWVTFYYAHNGKVADRMRTWDMPDEPLPQAPAEPPGPPTGPSHPLAETDAFESDHRPAPRRHSSTG